MGDSGGYSKGCLVYSSGEPVYLTPSCSLVL